MRSVGQVLKEARESKFLTLEDVEKHTKIRKELLQALEANNYDKLPPSTFIQGFIKNYSRFLGLNSEKLLAIFRRDYEAKKHPAVVLESFSKPLDNNKFQITPSRIVGVVVACVVVTFFGYLWYEYRGFVGAPGLEVISPKDQLTVELPQVLVEGKADPEIKVLVNNQEITVEKDGRFSQELKLSSSSNVVIITAVNKFGKSSKIERTVFVRRN